MSNSKRNLEFLFEIGCLRFIDRTWRQFMSPGFSNLAEHTLRVAWIALLISSLENVGDTGKIVKMAIVHDLAESRTGDVHYVSRQYTDRHEERAMRDILKGTSLEKEFVDLWNEYEKRECIEAKIVKDADHLDVDFELQEQSRRGNQLKEQWHEARKYVMETKFYTDSAKKLWEELYQADPDDWHVKGVNRFTSGDWRKEINAPFPSGLT